MSAPIFATTDSAGMLTEALLRMADAIEILETYTEDDEARQAALSMLKAGTR